MKQFTSQLRIKELKQDGTFQGYGSVFNNVDAYGDTIEPGAFKKTISRWKKKGKSPPMLWQHDSSMPIGVFTKLKEDEMGLYVEGQILLEVEKGKEAYALIKSGAIDGMSIGYVTNVEEWDNEGNTRKLKEIDLWEISIVTFPANSSALIQGVKSKPTSIKEFERFLREVGYSRTEAKAIASGGFKSVNSEQRDAEEVMKSLENLKNTIRS